MMEIMGDGRLVVKYKSRWRECVAVLFANECEEEMVKVK